MNAAKHQFTGQGLFMPPSELADYLSIGDATWRLNRGTALETIAFNFRVATASRSVTEAPSRGIRRHHPGQPAGSGVR